MGMLCHHVMHTCPHDEDIPFLPSRNNDRAVNIPQCAHAPHCDSVADDHDNNLCEHCRDPPNGLLPCGGCSVYDPDFKMSCYDLCPRMCAHDILSSAHANCLESRDRRFDSGIKHSFMFFCLPSRASPRDPRDLGVWCYGPSEGGTTPRELDANFSDTSEKRQLESHFLPKFFPRLSRLSREILKLSKILLVMLWKNPNIKDKILPIKQGRSRSPSAVLPHAHGAHCYTLCRQPSTSSALTALTASSQSIEWIVDSGASGIYTMDRSILTCVRRSSARVSGATKGADHMHADCQGNYGPFHNVVYFPAMSVNLLSVSMLKRQGFHVCLNDLVISKGKHKFCIIEDIASGLYKVHLPRVFPAGLSSRVPAAAPMHACVTYTSRNLAEVYHRRFNHTSKRAVLNTLKLHNMSVPSRHFARMRLCDGCALGKATNAPVPSAVPRRPMPKTTPKPAKFTKPFELVCVDTAGPVLPASHGGSKWMHVFKCKVTGYVHIACTKQRSGFYSEFVLFHRLLVLGQGHITRVVRSDNAPELVMGAFAEYRAQHGIISQTSPPYSSFANGYAENAIRNASRVIRALMADTAVPGRFWSYCALAYAHVFNRLPRLGKASPITLIKGTLPNLAYIRIFGCRCHVYMHPQERSKSARFDPVSQPAIFLGYVPQSKSFFVLVNGRVYKRRSVSFNEDVDELKNMHAPPRRSLTPTVNLREPVARGNGASTNDAPRRVRFDLTKQPAHVRAPASPAAISATPPVPPPAPSHSPEPDCGSFDSGPIGLDCGSIDEHVDDDAPPEVGELSNALGESESIAPPSPIREPVRRYPRRDRVPPPRSHPIVTGPQKFTGPLTRSRSKAALAEGSTTCSHSPMRECRDSTQNGSFWDVAQTEHALTVIKAASVATPRSYREAMASVHAYEWNLAVQRELKSMHDKQVWRVVPRTKQKPIGMRWVFKAKQDENGDVIKFKGRLVAKGFAQRYGVDFFEVWAPVARYTSIRALLAFAAKHDLTLRQLDADTAFLNAKLEETVYCTAPPGVSVPPGHVLLLQRSIYGTRQAARAWWLDIDSTFKNTLKMTPSVADPCLYYRYAHGTMTFVALFVDDIIIASNDDKCIEEVKRGLEKHYSLTDQGELRWCLGMRVTRDRNARTIYLDQERYVIDVLDRFDMKNCHPVSTPMCPNVKLSAEQCPTTAEEKRMLPSYHALYRSIVGSVSYAALSTRPDICTATIICAKYSHNPGKLHLVAAKRILRYLAGTARMCLTYGGDSMCGDSKEWAKHDPRGRGNLHMHGFTDSDWGGDSATRKSTSGYIFFWNGGPITWKSKMQSCIAQSTAEAEYIAASESSKECKWLRLIVGVFEHKGSEPSASQLAPTRIGCDNQAAISIIDNPRCSARTKHIELRYHLVRDYAQRGIVAFHYIPTAFNIADILTKPLNSVVLRRLCDTFLRELDPSVGAEVETK